MIEPTFEQSLDELKSIVQSLEKGDLPLEESLALFEKGVKLVSQCARKLDEVERKVELLSKDPNNTLKTQPFDDRKDR